MKKIILTLSILFFATKVCAVEPLNLPADIALQKLKQGNYRYASFQMKHPNVQKARRTKLITAQHPFAVVVTCSDSRVAPEIIFDQGLGDIFVIRNAGNVLDDHVLGSIEYAVHHLGVNLVVVLGHESCGAVGAAMKEEKLSPAIESIKEDIKPAICECQKDKSYSYENVIKMHAKLTAKEILQDDDLAEYAKKHELQVLPAYYSITSGGVEFLPEEE